MRIFNKDSLYLGLQWTFVCYYCKVCILTYFDMKSVQTRLTVSSAPCPAPSPKEQLHILTLIQAEAALT